MLPLVLALLRVLARCYFTTLLLYEYTTSLLYNYTDLFTPSSSWGAMLPLLTALLRALAGAGLTPLPLGGNNPAGVLGQARALLSVSSYTVLHDYTTTILYFTI